VAWAAIWSRVALVFPSTPPPPLGFLRQFASTHTEDTCKTNNAMGLILTPFRALSLFLVLSLTIYVSSKSVLTHSDIHVSRVFFSEHAYPFESLLADLQFRTMHSTGIRPSSMPNSPATLRYKRGSRRIIFHLYPTLI